MNKLRYFVLLLLAISSSVVGYAQSFQISGEVWDRDRKEPMLGVNVIVEGGMVGISTGLEGKFTLSVNEGDVLLFSFIGYDDVRRTVSKAMTNLKIEMGEQTSELEEVIVVGYGQQKKTSSVGSIATAKGEDLMKAGSVNSVSEALQGQMPGVTAINTTSKPGEDSADLFIRGKATWGDATPMVLVDGVERDFNDVDVNEIESISVLKDASATAVYGVKGANGVILLTTKRGKQGKTTVKFSANFGFKKPAATEEWADYPTAMEAYNQAATNDQRWDILIPYSTIQAWENAYATGNYGAYNDYFPEVNWQDEILKNFGFSHNYNVNISGGTERMNYFASLGYLYDGDIYKTEKQEDYDPQFYYKRYNWRTNFDFKLTSSTKVSVNVAGNMSYQNQPGYRIGTGDEYLFGDFITTPTNLFPIQYSDGTYGADGSGAGNLYAMLNEVGQRQYQTIQGFYDFMIDQRLDKFVKGLRIGAKLSYTSTSKDMFKIMSAGHYSSTDSSTTAIAYVREYRDYDYANPIIAEDGSVSYNMITKIVNPDEYTEEKLPVGTTYDTYQNYNHKLYYEVSLNYANTFGDNEVSALGVFNRRLERSGVAFPSYEEDWVGRATYAYKGKYLTEVNASYTGSEKFAPGYRFGFFPSFSLGWRLTEESFMEKIKHSWLSNVKFRYSWGKVGSDANADRFNYMQTYETGTSVKFGETSLVSSGTTYTEGTLAYPYATWETAIKQNIGVDITIKNKLNLMLDLFDEQRSGILMERTTVSPWIGVELPSQNLGETKNHGLEFEATWNDKIGKEFNYFVKYNFATSESRIVFRDDAELISDYLKYEGKPIGYSSTYLATGNYSSVDDIFNGTHTGISSTSQSSLVPGDLAYIDYNADGTLTSTDTVPAEDLNYPLTTMGLSVGFSYKGFSMSALFYAALGVYKSAIGSYLYDFPDSNVKAQPNVGDTWSYSDSYSTSLTRPSLHIENTYNQLSSYYNYTDHSYLRLKNLEVSYTIPKHITERFLISNCQVYLNGTNLFTISPCDSRRDPETSGANVYPIVKRYNVGVRVTFN